MLPLEDEGDVPLPLDGHVHGLADHRVLHVHVIYNNMEKEDGKLKVITEIRKERVATYPYYIVAATYSAHDHHFIVAADYRSEAGELSVYPFRDDMSRLTTSTLVLTDILPRKIIATIHVNSITFKPTSTSVTITQAEFVLGYRSGQLVVVEYKDRDCRVKQRFNRGLKGEGFFSKAASYFSGGEDSYAPYFKAPIRSFRLNPFSPDFYHIWQVGNCLVLQRELSEEKEYKFLTRHESMGMENFHVNYDINKVIKEGEYYCYGCEYYTMLEHAENKMAVVEFKEEVNSYANLPNRQEIVVGLASREEILVLDYSHFVLKSVIQLQIPLRNLSSFSRESQDYLILMPYENYAILFNLHAGKYCKLRGHKSFIANATYEPRADRIITAGMDHRICFIKVAGIPADSWLPVQREGERVKVKEFGVPDQKFDDVYHLGEYNNNRSNLSSYGYASVF
jgi:hypothetical protein